MAALSSVAPTLPMEPIMLCWFSVCANLRERNWLPLSLWTMHPFTSPRRATALLSAVTAEAAFHAVADRIANNPVGDTSLMAQRYSLLSAVRCSAIIGQPQHIWSVGGGIAAGQIRVNRRTWLPAGKAAFLPEYRDHWRFSWQRSHTVRSETMTLTARTSSARNR